MSATRTVAFAVALTVRGATPTTDVADLLRRALEAITNPRREGDGIVASRYELAPGSGDPPVCPNCGQWQHPRHLPNGSTYRDCLHECWLRGFVPEGTPR